ncbi:matrix metalloproteinase-2-like protein [Cinnamomum micranthum f. kanehirae]|uniref:Matrix metalloproteinase-2-like protein n=1 Tax=Cinnamomum micranthum f. kanehirae TaxID=337451 RepID=A0A3S3PUZ7_9MAGN|nr:matrix metalloproteinase-2-like protein [Cinnamomum micranthum f. kanehirae]
MVCLNRPFDQEEHDMLLDEAKTQKRLERSRDLRSRSVSYATKGRSSSYFDHYPDLERQIMFSNPHKSLALLRGFFFWLKNLSHEGAFPPWRTLPQDGQIVLFSANETATPAQVVIPEGIKEKSDIQLIEIEVPADVTEEETSMQPIQIEMAEGVNEVTDIQPIQIEIVSGTEESERF